MSCDLIYAHVPCPHCGQKLLALKAWLCPSGYDEDGHAHEAEIDSLVCPKCGDIEFDTDELEEKIEALIEEIMDAFWEHKLIETGVIYGYYPDLAVEKS